MCTPLLTRCPGRNCCLILAADKCPHSLFGFVGTQGHTEAGTANAGALDETINRYKQDKSSVSAACASPWVFTAHNSPQCTPTGAVCIPSPQAKYWLGVFWIAFSRNRLPAFRGGSAAKGKAQLRTHGCKKLHMGREDLRKSKSTSDGGPTAG